MKIFGFKVPTHIMGPISKAQKDKSQDQVKSGKKRIKKNKEGKSISQTKGISEKLLEKRLSKAIKGLDDLPSNEGVAKSLMEENLNASDLKSIAIVIASSEEKSALLIVSNKRIRVPLDPVVDKAKSVLRRDGWTCNSVYYMEQSLLEELHANNEKKIGKSNDNSEIADEFDRILKFACDNNVSDIHFEINEDKAVIRVRRNSLLEDYVQMGVDYAFDFCTVVYQVLSESESTDISFLPRRQQSSVVVRDIPGHGIVRVRLNTIPTAPSGFDMVLRVLKSGGDIKLNLEQLGYNKTLVKSLELASSKPVGALIIAGTTGSGKSTTLKTLLEGKVSQFMTPNGLAIKIITVEDPPEYDIQGVSQCNVSTSKAVSESASKNPFGDAIKAAMRCDPDILMAGEVRDEDSAELLMHITLSGHQVMTTIHASSAISIVARLRNNGVPNDALGNSDFLSALVYQKLVPKVCKDCGIEYANFLRDAASEPELELLSRMNQVIPDSKRDNIYFRNKSGCENCKSGVIGQTVIAEVILPDHIMLEHFISAEDHKAWHHHKKMGGKTIIDHAHEKIINGVCDPRDIEVKIGLITMDLVMEDSKFEYSEMEKHGVKLQEKDFEYVNIVDLNEVRRAKVIRATKLMAAKLERGEVKDRSLLDENVYANMLHNDIYSPSELLVKLADNGISFSENELSLFIDEIITILR